MYHKVLLLMKSTYNKIFMVLLVLHAKSTPLLLIKLYVCPAEGRKKHSKDHF